MKVYEYRKNKNKSIFFPETWSNEFTSEKVEFFIRGKGYKKVSVNKVIEVADISMNCFRYKTLSDTFQKYGFAVAHELIKHSDCRSAEICYYGYICLAVQSKNPEHLDLLVNKFNFDVRKHVSRLIAFGVYLFPIIKFDECLHKIGYSENKHGSISDYLQNVHNLKLEF